MSENVEIIPLISENGDCVSHENCVKMEGKFCQNGRCVEKIGEGFSCFKKNNDVCNDGLICNERVNRCLKEEFEIPEDSCTQDNHCIHKSYCYDGKCLFKGGLNSRCSDSNQCINELACVFGTCRQRCMTHRPEDSVEPNQVQYFLKTGRCPNDKVCRSNRQKMVCMNVKRGSIEFQFVWRYAVWYASIVGLFVVVIKVLRIIKIKISNHKKTKKKTE